MAVRQAAVANMQRGVKLATVYSTFRGTFQKTHTTRGHATIVCRTVTTPPDNAPSKHSLPMLDTCVHTALALHRDCDDPKKAACNTPALLCFNGSFSCVIGEPERRRL